METNAFQGLFIRATNDIMVLIRHAIMSGRFFSRRSDKSGLICFADHGIAFKRNLSRRAMISSLFHRSVHRPGTNAFRKHPRKRSSLGARRTPHFWPWRAFGGWAEIVVPSRQRLLSEEGVARRMFRQLDPRPGPKKELSMFVFIGTSQSDSDMLSDGGETGYEVLSTSLWL